jgi:hypothetical protein
VGGHLSRSALSCPFKTARQALDKKSKITFLLSEGTFNQQTMIHDNRELPANSQTTRTRHQPSINKTLRLLLLLILICCATAWLVYLAPSDVTHYQCDALVFWFGSHATTWLPTAQCTFLGISSPQQAFHLLPSEYPPLSILLFSIPLLVPLPYYAPTFALFMFLITGFILWLLAHFHSQHAARHFLLSLGLGASVLVQVRFDIFPAACMLICLLAAERKRWNLAYSALAIGVLLKLYPIVALPALFIAEQEAYNHLSLSFGTTPEKGGAWWRQAACQVVGWQWKHFSLFCGILAGVTGGFALLNLQAVVGPVGYLLQRPIQIESLQSSLLWLAHYAGIPFQIIFSYGSLNILSPVSSAASQTGTGLLVLGSLFIFHLQWKQKLPLGQAVIALLCLLIATGKVFSPQYLIWLIPLIAYVGAARLWLYGWGAILVFTAAIYVGYYSQLNNSATAAQTIQMLPGFFVAVSIRNGAFLILTLAYLFNWFNARQRLVSQQALIESACSGAASKSKTQSSRVVRQ